MHKKSCFYSLLTVFLILAAIYLIKSSSFNLFLNEQIQKREVKGVSFHFIPKEIEVDGHKKVKYPQDFTFVLLGDSMIERMGNSDNLRADLRNFYPNKSFEILNYGYGSTNLLSAHERLVSQTEYGRIFRPIMDIDFDIIFVESFGHNPLSQFSLEEGLKKQNEALDDVVKIIREGNPHAKIIFIATIAPSKKHYGEKVNNLSQAEREKWANERIAYIENHIAYAKSHNIPLIDIFSKSLGSDKDLNLDYVNPDDYIHPSKQGLKFIEDEIANYIVENHILQN